MSPARYIMIGGFLGAGKSTAMVRLGEHLRASGLEVRSTPADAYRDKYRSDDVEALRRDLEATM